MMDYRQHNFFLVLQSTFLRCKKKGSKVMLTFPNSTVAQICSSVEGEEDEKGELLRSWSQRSPHEGREEKLFGP